MPSVTDSAVMRLAHPVRLFAAFPEMMELQRQLYRNEWPVIVEMLSRKDLVLSEAGYQMTAGRNMPILTSMVGQTQYARGNTENGGVYALMSAMRHRLIGYTMFKFDDALVNLLQHTDLDDDIPLSYLLPPFPFTCVELGTHRDLDVYVENELSGKHVLEGAYVERGWHRDVGDCLYFILTGSPLGHTDAVDDATTTILLPLADPTRPLGETLAEMAKIQWDQAVAAGLKPTPQETVPGTLEALKLVAKALLYLSLPGVRKEARPDATEQKAALKNVTSGSKRAKAERKLAKAYDYILVLPPAQEPGGSGPAAGHASPKPHWRRGHYRMQVHGEGRSLRKLVFIAPTLVAADKGEPTVSPKEYRVK